MKIKKSSKRSSGGIILYIRNEYISKDSLIYTNEDDIIWIKIEKSLCSLDNDLFVGLCYVIPDDSSRQSMVETNIFFITETSPYKSNPRFAPYI